MVSRRLQGFLLYKIGFLLATFIFVLIKNVYSNLREFIVCWINLYLTDYK